MEEKKTSLLFHISKIEDPRDNERIHHPFVTLLFISICALISGCEHYTEIEDFADSKKDWLSNFVDMSMGVPSHDTFRRLFCILDFSRFQEFFINWTHSVKESLGIKKDQIGIDGKRIRGSFCESKFVKALHMVNAWSTQAGLSLGSEPTDKKSNEITAIPKLLELLKLKGCLVSIDAIGCQTEIASKVIEKGGGYLLALKGNQTGLQEAVEEVFRRSETNSKTKLIKERHIEKEEGIHNRDMERICEVIPLTKKIDFLHEDKWKNLSSLIRVKCTVKNLSTREQSYEVRFYISSAKSTAKDFQQAVKNHWGVENKLHWQLDVTMREDHDKKWVEQAVKNFSLARQTALNLLRKEPSKMGLKRKQRKASYDNAFLEKIIFSCC